MTLRLAPPPCRTEGCGNTAVKAYSYVTDGKASPGPSLCGECSAIIELVMETTNRIVRTGVPRDVAAEWAGEAVRKVCQ